MQNSTENDERLSKEQEEIWHNSRRVFIRNILLGAAALHVPFLISCESDESLQLNGKGIFTDKEMHFLYSIQNILFPADGNGPSAADVQAHTYMVSYLSDDLLPNSDKEYFIEGLKKIISFSKEVPISANDCYDYTIQDWEKLVERAAEVKEHKNFLGRVLTLIFEALLLDPIYGGNTNEIGWNWLHHTAGQPRITEEYKYPHYITAVNTYQND